MLTLNTSPSATLVPYRSDVVEFAAHPAVVATARLHIRGVLRTWELKEFSEDAEQVVSEAITNSVEAHQREHLCEPVRLTLLAGLDTLLIIVRDRSDLRTVLGTPDINDEDGRGLLIVNAIAAVWDVKAVPGGGKALRVLLKPHQEGSLTS